MGNLLNALITDISVGGNRLFHCGDLKIKTNTKLFPSLLPKEKESSCGHAELVSASLAERTGQFPSPREEGVGERVQLEEKINPSLKIVSFRKMLKDNFSQPYGTQSHKVQLHFTCSASVSLGESSGCPVKHLGYLKKCAFTLAEVLITLGIIGVVAAITIPSLVTNYQKHVVETKLAKFNSTMNQAMRLSMVDNGDPDGWLERNHNYSYPETVEFIDIKEDNDNDEISEQRKIGYFIKGHKD